MPEMQPTLRRPEGAEKKITVNTPLKKLKDIGHREWDLNLAYNAKLLPEVMCALREIVYTLTTSAKGGT